MSFHVADEPVCTDSEGLIELVIEPQSKDLGGFSVRRVLPSAKRRLVGPFIFFDHIGPAVLPPGKGIQVRPHPHIGLATVTYLFEGEIIHRDSLGFTQAIRPGAVNLMTAGRGIVHSERAGDDLHTTSHLHGIQSWMALPHEKEERDPDFVHYPATGLPEFEEDGVGIRVIIGEASGHRSPVSVDSRTIYLELRMPAGTTFRLPNNDDELAVYLVEGEIGAGTHSLAAGLLAVACPGQDLCLEATADSHVMVIGGDAMGSRHIWWNFVSSSRDRIEQAKRDWKDDNFDSVPGETEFIPLPE